MRHFSKVNLLQKPALKKILSLDFEKTGSTN
ncbi:hypothetical protein P872_21135 [Rhodonellum psychrophilum GCM71 = DSM 17998]|uniref:Uncharacterized protein n=1 Tax=Rhodonellum psychrophilum GCM71 = DSM 17998 TaxID=1123057 RepID=U5BS76_9BACT|nr:hypothetical protein P872_21135 [Rhodonellum psychrophilum GCM71 = DSM 17998]